MAHEERQQWPLQAESGEATFVEGTEFEDGVVNIEVKVINMASGEFIGDWLLPRTAFVGDLLKNVYAALANPSLFVTLFCGDKELLDIDTIASVAVIEGPLVLNCIAQRTKFAEEPDPRLHFNVVFLGHIGHGKSTACGNILMLSGCAEKRIVERCRQLEEEHRFLAGVMDTTERETNGRTLEVARFETRNRRFTILEAQRFRAYVPSMIAGASQADIGVLIISAIKGEFESGFERGGQTVFYASLAKTLGVQKLCLCVTKMDHDSVQWSQTRYNEIIQKMSPLLRHNGFKAEQVLALPISGLKGDNVKKRLATPSWFTGDSLLDTLDSVQIPRCSKDAPLVMTMLQGCSEMGAVIARGKVEQGTIRPGKKCIIMPIQQQCTIQTAYINRKPVQFAITGENVTLEMLGCSEDHLSKGFVLSQGPSTARAVTKFKAMLKVITLPCERPILTAGFKAVLQIHVASEDCEILKLHEACPTNDMTNKQIKPVFVRNNSIVLVSVQLTRPTTVDICTGCPRLSRFTLHDESSMIAIGKITQLPKRE